MVPMTDDDAAKLFCPVPNFVNDVLSRSPCMGSKCQVWEIDINEADYSHRYDCAMVKSKSARSKRYYAPLHVQWTTHPVPLENCDCDPERTEIREGHCGLKQGD